MGKVTLKQIKEQFPNYLDHEQIDSKQLFVLTKPVDDREGTVPHQLLISYRTIVGRRYFSKDWELTKQKYSVTTTQQLNYFARNRNVIWVDNLHYFVK